MFTRPGKWTPRSPHGPMWPRELRRGEDCGPGCHCGHGGPRFADPDGAARWGLKPQEMGGETPSGTIQNGGFLLGSPKKRETTEVLLVF